MGLGRRKTKVGVVISNNMDKTVVVATVSTFQHPSYKKVVKQAQKFKAHDAENKCSLGDKVKIIETRPLSREKCWRVIDIIGKEKIKTAQEIDAELKLIAEESSHDSSSDSATGRG